MSGNVAALVEPAPIIACTISRDVQEFDLLIEDMETELGESWGDLSVDDALAFFGQPDAESRCVRPCDDQTPGCRCVEVEGVSHPICIGDLRRDDE